MTIKYFTFLFIMPYNLSQLKAEHRSNRSSGLSFFPPEVIFCVSLPLVNKKSATVVNMITRLDASKERMRSRCTVLQSRGLQLWLWLWGPLLLLYISYSMRISLILSIYNLNLPFFLHQNKDDIRTRTYLAVLTGV
jgi:hypothetical protein